jgi:hypothetical protein
LVVAAGLDGMRTYGLPFLTMWLRELRVKNLKRLRDFTLDLRGPGGEPRKWTVIIGPNGTGKTSILQAAALAAAGNFRADDLVKDLRASLPDKRLERVVKSRAGMKPRSISRPILPSATSAVLSPTFTHCVTARCRSASARCCAVGFG